MSASGACVSARVIFFLAPMLPVQNSFRLLCGYYWVCRVSVALLLFAHSWLFRKRSFASMWLLQMGLIGPDI